MSTTSIIDNLLSSPSPSSTLQHCSSNSKLNDLFNKSNESKYEIITCDNNNNNNHSNDIISSPSINQANYVLDDLCCKLSELATNQRETNNLLRQYIQSKNTLLTTCSSSSSTINKSLNDTNQSLNLSLSNIIYMKRRGMSLLITLTKNSLRKIWCTECNKKVSVIKKTNQQGINVLTNCGHFTSCDICKNEIIQQILRCNHCNPCYNNNYQTSEQCPVCDSNLIYSNYSSIVNNNNILPNSYVLVKQNDTAQCIHLSSNITGIKRSRNTANINDDTNPSPSKKPLFNLSQHMGISSPVYDGVLGIGKKAFQVGTDILTRITYYEEDEHGLFINH